MTYATFPATWSTTTGDTYDHGQRTDLLRSVDTILLILAKSNPTVVDYAPNGVDKGMKLVSRQSCWVSGCVSSKTSQKMCGWLILMWSSPYCSPRPIP